MKYGLQCSLVLGNSNKNPVCNSTVKLLVFHGTEGPELAFFAFIPKGK